MSGPGRNKDGNRGGMVMETIRDYEAMVYILEHNRKSAGKGKVSAGKKYHMKN